VVAPGNEIPKWFNHQSEGYSIIVELHPGWFSNKWMGFALCVVFRLLKPLPPSLWGGIYCSLIANGMKSKLDLPALHFGERSGAQPVSDHIWLLYAHRDRYFFDNWQDIYYQLEFSFKHYESLNGNVEMKKCAVRMIYEEDAEELRQTIWKQRGINTKRGLQYYDHTASVSQEEEEEPHPKRFKQLNLDLDGPRT
jgi:hypothetical protein